MDDDGFHKVRFNGLICFFKSVAVVVQCTKSEESFTIMA